jgi:hypothetical protein
MTIFDCASPEDCGWVQSRDDRWEPFDLLGFAVNLRDLEARAQKRL